MIKVAGAWEYGYNTPFVEYDQWAFPLRDFGVDEWYMAPISGIKKKGLTEVADLRETLELNPDLVPVYLDEKGEIELQDFEHPENVLYLCGKAAYSPYRDHGSTGISLRIKTKLDGGLLWPHQCVVLALYDRMVKEWQSQ